MYYGVDGQSFEKLEDASEDFIENRRVALAELALSKLPEVQKNPQLYGDDGWFMVGLGVTGDVELVADSDIQPLADINVWLDEEGWKGAVYPMEINSVGEEQTNCGTWKNLFGGQDSDAKLKAELTEYYGNFYNNRKELLQNG